MPLYDFLRNKPEFLPYQEADPDPRDPDINHAPYEGPPPADPMRPLLPQPVPQTPNGGPQLQGLGDLFKLLAGQDTGALLHFAQAAGPAAEPDLTHYNRANESLKMTPQEQAFYKRHLSNLGKGPLATQSGGQSTVLGTTVGSDGKVYLVPTIWGDQKLQAFDPNKPGEMKHIMNMIEEAGGLDTFPSYASEEEAQKRYKSIHEFMEQDLPR